MTEEEMLRRSMASVAVLCRIGESSSPERVMEDVPFLPFTLGDLDAMIYYTQLSVSERKMEHGDRDR